MTYQDTLQVIPPRTVSLGNSNGSTPVYVGEKEDVPPTVPPLPFSRGSPYDSRQPSITLSEAPQNNAHVDSLPGYAQKRSAQPSIHSSPPSSRTLSRAESRDFETFESDLSRDSSSLPVTQTIPSRQREIKRVSDASHHSQVAEVSTAESSSYQNSASSAVDAETEATEETSLSDESQSPPEPYPALQYHHQPLDDSPSKPSQDDKHSYKSDSQTSSSGNTGGSARSSSSALLQPQTTLPRSSSAYTLGSELNAARGRAPSPHLSVNGSPRLSPSNSPLSHARPQSAQRRSPESRPVSYVDLLNTPYQQQAPPANLDNTFLRSNVGTNASLLDPKKTLQMYRLNVKKTNDPAIQYEFAVFMVKAARDAAMATRTLGPSGSGPSPDPSVEMLREARSILQRLADRGYPFAQYYLGDGYASGLFNKGKEDWERAFPLFVAASKHGHAEAGYRAALCYEFGWGCRKDYAKAVQFYRASASKNHPGAATRLGKACLTGDMGLGNRYREGLKWLKRAAESADPQYNSAPYELGLLHMTGFGDDCFKDEAYAAQLFTQAAELGHPVASLRMGEAYEHGLLCCPRDPALSVHFYNGAAQAGIPEAMMNLCAWYMVGAEPVLEKDECEAYEWAKNAAEMGLPKAEYAVGYFTEMGIGCRRDPLEANVWYVRAADQGDERAKQRLAIIRAAASGEAGVPMAVDKSESKKGGGDKDCIVM